jgi:hypothetical protein
VAALRPGGSIWIPLQPGTVYTPNPAGPGGGIPPGLRVPRGPITVPTPGTPAGPPSPGTGQTPTYPGTNVIIPVVQGASTPIQRQPAEVLAGTLRPTQTAAPDLPRTVKQRNWVRPLLLGGLPSLGLALGLLAGKTPLSRIITAIAFAAVMFGIGLAINKSIEA